MSNTVSADIRRRDLGIGYSPKSVLLLLADLASDDGSGIFASKVTIAAELETARSTVQRAIQYLISAGLLIEIGVRGRGVIEYRIVLERVHDVPMMPGYRDGPRRSSGAKTEPDSGARPVAERDRSPQHVDQRTQDVACSAPLHVAERYSKCSGALHQVQRSATQTKRNLKEPLARATAVEAFGEDVVKAAEFWAGSVREGRTVPSSAVRVQVADAMLAMKLATADQLRLRSIHFTETEPRNEQRGTTDGSAVTDGPGTGDAGDADREQP